MPGTNTNSLDPELQKKQQEQEEQEQQQTVPPTPPAEPAAVNTPSVGGAPAPVIQEQQPKPQRYLDQILAQYDERKKRNKEADRRNRVRETIGGIGDVASALAKMHFTTQYAPYVGGENLSEKARQRADLAKANRDKYLDQWMHYVLNVAGKKQAAEQAERTRQDTKDHRDAVLQQRKAELQQKAEAAQKKEKEATQKATESKEDAAIKRYDTTFGPQLEAWARDGETAKLDEERNNLKKKRDAGEISERLYKGMDDAITKAINTVANKNSQTKYNAKYKTSGRESGGGSNAQISTHKGIVEWPKSLLANPSNVRKIYNKLPEDFRKDVELNYPGKILSSNDMWSLIEDFFDSDCDDDVKDGVHDAMVNLTRGGSGSGSKNSDSKNAKNYTNDTGKSGVEWKDQNTTKNKTGVTWK